MGSCYLGPQDLGHGKGNGRYDLELRVKHGSCHFHVAHGSVKYCIIRDDIM